MSIEPTKLKSCGFLILRKKNESLQFLLMKHANRYDLTKGHMEKGESEMETAKRELKEEIGVSEKDINIIDGFRYEETYKCKYKRLKFIDQEIEKTVVIFLAELKDPKQEFVLTEHKSFEWMYFKSPMKPIQKNTIDPLLKELDKFLSKKEEKVEHNKKE